MDKMKVNVVMPMLGRGSRMLGVQNTCKPLMKLPTGEFFFMKALTSLKNYDIQILVLVVLKDYFDDFSKLEGEVRKLSDAKFVVIIPHDPTYTPVESFRIGFMRVWNTWYRYLPLFCLDCDIYGEIPTFMSLRSEAGRLFYFHDTAPNKCYIATLPHDDSVVYIAEKRVISDKAVIGAYLFEDVASLFKILSYSSVRFSYLSGIFNALLKNGRIIRASPAANVTMFGTLEELNQYGK